MQKELGISSRLWALIASVSFSPVLFLTSLLYVSPFLVVQTFLFGEQPATWQQYTGAAASAVVQAAALGIIAAVALRKFDRAATWTSMVRIVYYFGLAVVLPMFVVIGILGAMGRVEGGDGLGLLYVFLFAAGFYAILSLLPVFFFSVIFYLGLVQRKKYAVLVLAVATAALGWYTFTEAMVLGCPRDDVYCIARRAATGSDVGKCEQAYDPRLCYQELAALQKSPETCEILPAEHRQECLNIVTEWKAYDTADPDACGAIVCPGGKDTDNKNCRNDQQRCYERGYELLALRTGDPAYCREASRYPDLWLSPEAAILQERFDTTRCYTFSALKHNNPSLCAGLSEAAERKRCEKDVANCRLEDSISHYRIRPDFPVMLYCAE